MEKAKRFVRIDYNTAQHQSNQHAMERGDTTYYVDEKQDDYYTNEQYNNDKSRRSSKCCKCTLKWSLISVINSLAIILLAVLMIVAYSGHPHTHNNTPTKRTMRTSVKIGPVKSTRTYKFKLTGVYARYPSDGSVLPDLSTLHKGVSTMCCDYTEKNGNKEEKRVCSISTDKLNFDIHTGSRRDGSFIVVSTPTGELIGAQCTLHWVA